MLVSVLAMSVQVKYRRRIKKSETTYLIWYRFLLSLRTCAKKMICLVRGFDCAVKMSSSQLYVTLFIRFGRDQYEREAPITFAQRLCL